MNHNKKVWRNKNKMKNQKEKIISMGKEIQEKTERIKLK